MPAGHCGQVIRVPPCCGRSSTVQVRRTVGPVAHSLMTADLSVSSASEELVLDAVAGEGWAER
ncbi:hypothetical protein DY245_42165 [Streptomyces inhibens]|uniref:Uncharacterized protein n=1 Tax=Streptomyces inhibens TaxID=2293571 RepID=A0A371PQ58_STRIH|nr:hypothetical protein DY245_42165 [Streptomyces inhibens]